MDAAALNGDGAARRARQTTSKVAEETPKETKTAARDIVRTCSETFVPSIHPAKYANCYGL
jgi:hypothetical protein